MRSHHIVFVVRSCRRLKRRAVLQLSALLYCRCFAPAPQLFDSPRVAVLMYHVSNLCKMDLSRETSNVPVPPVIECPWTLLFIRLLPSNSIFRAVGNQRASVNYTQVQVL